MDNFGCQLDKPGKKEPQLRNFLHWIEPWSCLQGIFLIVNLSWEAQSTMGSAIPGQVAECEPGSQPRSSTLHGF